VRGRGVGGQSSGKLAVGTGLAVGTTGVIVMSSIPTESLSVIFT
jgi:hypothetical protein